MKAHFQIAECRQSYVKIVPFFLTWSAPSPGNLHVPDLNCTFPHALCHSPHALKGQKLLAQGTALGIHVRTPGALKGQKLYMAPRISGFVPQSIFELATGFYHMRPNIPFWYIR